MPITPINADSFCSQQSTRSFPGERRIGPVKRRSSLASGTSVRAEIATLLGFVKAAPAGRIHVKLIAKSECVFHPSPAFTCSTVIPSKYRVEHRRALS